MRLTLRSACVALLLAIVTAADALKGSLSVTGGRNVPLTTYKGREKDIAAVEAFQTWLESNRTGNSRSSAKMNARFGQSVTGWSESVQEDQIGRRVIGHHDILNIACNTGDGVALAKARRNAMVVLIRHDPKSAVQYHYWSLPYIRAQPLPKPVQPYVPEKTFEGMGTIYVACAMMLNGLATHAQDDYKVTFAPEVCTSYITSPSSKRPP